MTVRAKPHDLASRITVNLDVAESHETHATFDRLGGATGLPGSRPGSRLATPSPWDSIRFCEGFFIGFGVKPLFKKILQRVLQYIIPLQRKISISLCKRPRRL